MHNFVASKKIDFIVLSFITSVVIALTGIFFLFSAPLVAASTSTINVNLTIPSPPPPPPPPVLPPNNPPTISNVSVSTSVSAATITWNAASNKGISSVSFSYGRTASYGTSGTVTGNYQTTVSALNPGTQYFYQILVTDTGGNNTYYNGNFTTLSVDLTPPVISSLAVTVNVSTATVSWQTNKLADGQLSYGLTASYGSVQNLTAYTLNHSILLTNLLATTTYHYRVISTDQSGNAASTGDLTFKTLPDAIPPADVSNFTLNATTNTLALFWTNPLDPDFNKLQIIRKINSAPTTPLDGVLLFSGITTTYSDSAVAQQTNYYYTIFSYDTSGNRSGGAFINGQLLPLPIPTTTPSPTSTPVVTTTPTPAPTTTPAITTTISNFPVPPVPPITPPVPPIPTVTPLPSVPPTGIAGGGTKIILPPVTVSSTAKISADKLIFLTANRQIKLTLQNNTVIDLDGMNFTVGLALADLPMTPKGIFLTIDGKENHLLSRLSWSDHYYADLAFPAHGAHEAYVEIDYGNDQKDVLGFSLQSLPLGRVVSDSEPLRDVTVKLFNEDNSTVEVGVFGQQNPILTGLNGTFGWVIPNGNYYLTADKNSYFSRKTPVFTVENNVINNTIELIATPPPLDLNIEHLSKLVNSVSKISIQKIGDTAQVIRAAAANPEVQKTVSQVVAPSAVSVVAVSAATIVSWTDIIPLLQLIILQPWVFFGRKRKRAAWGQVYNALNKMPVDLATVRLISNDNGRVIQTRVTDFQGRYAFFVSPGIYRLQVIKNNLLFPSVLLKDDKIDGDKIDIYHGELITAVEKDVMITANIPLDPIGDYQKPVRIFWQRAIRRLQGVISVAGILVTILAIVIAPRWYLWVLLGVNLLVFVISHYLAAPQKIKSWGIVYDSATMAPIGRTVARLFNVKFNKLVASQITDGKGRYYFLAANDEYHIIFEHPNYEPEKTPTIDLRGRPSEVINVDVKLKSKTANKSETSSPTTSSAEPDNLK